MTSIMAIAHEEMARHGVSRLTLLRVRYGALSNVEPEALRMAFQAMVAGTPHAEAHLDLVEEPLHARCTACGHEFVPQPKLAIFGPCPGCGQLTPYQVDSSSGIYLDHLEALE